MYNEQNDSIIFGRNAVTEYLKSGKRADTVYFAQGDNPHNAYIAALAKQSGAVTKTLHPAKLSFLCGSDKHQGVAAAVSLVEFSTVRDMLNYAAEKGEAPFIVIADSINDPHNLGAIIRTAECAGAHGVVIPERGGCGVTPTVFMSSSGAAAHLRIARVTNLAAEVRELKKNNVFVYCADMDGDPLWKTNLTGPICLIIGSEGEGVAHLLKQLCDGSVALPMVGSIGSLNASVAAGVVMYEIVRQRVSTAQGK